MLTHEKHHSQAAGDQDFTPSAIQVRRAALKPTHLQKVLKIPQILSIVAPHQENHSTAESLMALWNDRGKVQVSFQEYDLILCPQDTEVLLLFLIQQTLR